jgi:hypothetical protein
MQTDTTQLQKLRGKQNRQWEGGLGCAATEERVPALLLHHLILELISLACVTADTRATQGHSPQLRISWKVVLCISPTVYCSVAYSYSISYIPKNT